MSGYSKVSTEICPAPHQLGRDILQDIEEIAIQLPSLDDPEPGKPTYEPTFADRDEGWSLNPHIRRIHLYETERPRSLKKKLKGDPGYTNRRVEMYIHKDWFYGDHRGIELIYDSVQCDDENLLEDRASWLKERFESAIRKDRK